jgi:2-oxoglutarate ferredoxin oxidoreductase subunit alpha
MRDDIFTYIIGGKAGQGTKKAGLVAANFFADMKRYVFQMNDYPSLIRGGQNFSVVSTSLSKIYSHYMDADLVVALDRQTYEIHKHHVNKNGLMVFNSDKITKGGIGLAISSQAQQYENSDLIEGVAGIAVLAAFLRIPKAHLQRVVKQEYGQKNKDNQRFAETIYDEADHKIPKKRQLKSGKQKKPILTGSETIGFGAVAAGLDLYFAYPMTPSTPVLHFFAQNGKRLGVVAIQPENEIAVANMAIGATVTGARSMVGTSGGGFCLMQEAFSLAGMTEAPVLFFIGQRPGPSTGVPTYTEQGELLFSLYPGQGEFPRIVASPGNIEEAYYLTAELLNLIWRFQTPGILLSEKHLCESSMSVRLNPYNTHWETPKLSTSKHYQRYKFTHTGVSPLLFPPSNQLINWNSYEHDEAGFTTEEADVIARMHEKRQLKSEQLQEYLKKHVKTVNVFGNGSPYIFTFGSTTMSVLEALRYINKKATVIQPIYLQPFPSWELKKYQKREKTVVVEQNITGQLQQLLKEKIGIEPALSIRQYNGRPFDPIDLGTKLQEVT